MTPDWVFIALLIITCWLVGMVSWLVIQFIRELNRKDRV